MPWQGWIVCRVGRTHRGEGKDSFQGRISTWQGGLHPGRREGRGGRPKYCSLGPHTTGLTALSPRLFLLLIIFSTFDDYLVSAIFFANYVVASDE